MSIPRSLRAAVRERAAYRCEYCRLPEDLDQFPHHIDHIRAVKHDGSSEINNLALACFECNTSKGSNIAAYDPETGQLVPLFNPRTQDWPEHFILDGFRIRGTTPEGRATSHILNMNDPSQIDARRFFINTGRW